MRTNKLFFLVGIVVTAVLFGAIAAHGDGANQSTTITFNKPVAIPGEILPAGTYEFRLMDRNDFNWIQVLNSDGTHLYATLQTIRTERRVPTDATAITVAQPESEGVDLLLKWFYPNETDGHEFLYPRGERERLAHWQQRTLLAGNPAETTNSWHLPGWLF